MKRVFQSQQVQFQLEPPKQNPFIVFHFFFLQSLVESPSASLWSNKREYIYIYGSFFYGLGKEIYTYLN
jgi:hypothetical protein